jgi:hypothetical protein
MTVLRELVFALCAIPFFLAVGLRERMGHQSGGRVVAKHAVFGGQIEFKRLGLKGAGGFGGAESSGILRLRLRMMAFKEVKRRLLVAFSREGCALRVANADSSLEVER